MTVLAAAFMIMTEQRSRMDLPLAPGVKAYKGCTMMGRPSTGYVYPAVKGSGAAGANDIFLGVCNDTVDNSAATATTMTVTVNFIKEKSLMWRTNDGSITASTRFNPIYAADDNTVSTTSTNAPKLGVCLDVDATLGACFEIEGV
jgi:hypothetical protein